MAIRDALLAEFDHEMATARKLVERVPEEKFDWAPHPKSMKMGRLAGHIAELPGWGVAILTQDSMDIAPPGGPQSEAFVPKTKTELLSTFDKNVAGARAALASTKDEDFIKPWSLLRAGQTVMTMPKIAVVRTFVLNHGIHHRGQLAVYLRLNDIPVPSIYGPSADEGGM
jgi:uncharacterized damage-inducible protein DinB